MPPASRCSQIPVQLNPVIQGAPGATGPTGPSGPSGAIGPSGPAGPAGVTVATANGFAGTVSGGGAITLTTTVNGVMAGDGTNLSAATGTQIATALGSSPVLAANQITALNCIVKESTVTAGQLNFYNGATLLATLSPAGNLAVLGSVSAFATLVP